MVWVYLRSGMSLLAAVCLLTASSSTSHAAIIRDSPNLGTYSYNGFTCFKCPPGTYLERHCTEDFTYSLCNPCPVDTFQSHYSQATRCSPCQTFCLHDDNMEVVENCTSTQDLKCQCKQGYYLHVLHVFTDTKTCKKYSSCTQGKVMIKNGTPTSDIECGYCPDGQFSRDGQCWTCSSCTGENTTLVTPCNATSDVRCHHHPTNGSGDSGTENTDIPTHMKDGNVDVAVVVVPLVLLFLGIAAGLVTCYVIRRKGVKNINRIELGERRISAPLIDRSNSTSSAQPVRTKQRTFSGSSAVSPRPVSSFPDLKDPDTWKLPVFDVLCRRLTNWKRFMRHLPGEAGYTACVNSRCEQIEKEEQGNVREQIHKSLQEWSQWNTDKYVKVDSILDTIEQVIEHDDQLYKDVWDLCCDLAKKTKTAKYSK
ncbi:tumor necrosis factor receptor superfamily member 21-like [Haliotis asinina]|uniref:tumor necrosis factor receptor superfamily member 21-like n=1 Tax=Haliotis asinina TaxID=109174 RepID=UPI003531FE57